ncbi:MAG: site-specific integrase, partial [Thermoplasmata archaeon]|nr:site-specific integrase [Candidatus Sysuiplasma jiujiangense]
MTKYQQGRYLSLLDDENFRRWYQNVARRHESTAKNYLRCIGKLCDIINFEPKALIELPQRERDNIILDYISKRERKGITGASIKVEIKALKSWLKWNDIEIKRPIRIRNANLTTTLDSEVIPDQEQLRSILNVATPQQKVAIALVAFSGVRLEVLGNYNGSDGLRLSDFPELQLQNETVTFLKVPTLVRIRRELSKTGYPYFTFLGQEGCDYVKAFIEKRFHDTYTRWSKKGEKKEVVDMQSPLIVPAKVVPDFISTVNIGDIIRKPMRLAGNTNRPYVLRSYFATKAMQAEAKGFQRDWRVFMMGHKGDIEHIYTLNKNHLRPDLIEQMRDGYKAALPFLETVKQPSTIDRSEFLRQFMKSAGMTDDQIEQQGEVDIIKVIKDKLGIGGNPETPKRNNSAQSAQRIIRLSELDNYLTEGYEFVHELP